METGEPEGNGGYGIKRMEREGSGGMGRKWRETEETEGKQREMEGKRGIGSETERNRRMKKESSSEEERGKNRCSLK
jgi:hypothetical protein